ncbi:MAG TPA: hypothetical protein VFQ60_00420 [Patescibacteria group bacterium]|nr:hypothetical protein [Patescibacteria group bacterium]
MPQGPGNQNQGPNEEEQRKMDAQNLARMQKGMKQAEKQLNQMKTYFTKQAKKGIAIPDDCTQAMNEVQQIIDSIKNAQSFEDANNVDPQSMGDNFQTINDCRQRVDMLSRIPQMLKQVDRSIKNIQTQWARAKKGAPEEANSTIAEGDALIQGIKDARANVDQMLKDGNIDDLDSTIQDDIFNKFDDFGGIIQRVSAVKNSKKFFSDFTRQLKQADQTIAKLKKSGKDTSEAEQILSEMKQAFANLKGMDVGSDDFMSTMEDLMQHGMDFGDALGIDQNPNVDQLMGQGPSGPSLQMPQF